MTIHAYHFFGDTLRDGTPIPADGEVLRADERPLELCRYGLHASRHPFDALTYAPGPNLAIVELGGEVVAGHNKLCASERTIIARIDATDLLRQFARNQAASVLHLWDAPDVVRQYLATGDEKLRAAAWAAEAAAGAAAWTAGAAAGAAEAAAEAAAVATAWAAEAAARAAARTAWCAAEAAARTAARTAWCAAEAAANDAAWAAAGAAAEAAAEDAARAAAGAEFKALVDAAFAHD